MPQSETPHEDTAASSQRDADNDLRDESEAAVKRPGRSGGYMKFGAARKRQKFRFVG